MVRCEVAREGLYEEATFVRAKQSRYQVEGPGPAGAKAPPVKSTLGVVKGPVGRLSPVASFLPWRP